MAKRKAAKAKAKRAARETRQSAKRSKAKRGGSKREPEGTGGIGAVMALARASRKRESARDRNRRLSREEDWMYADDEVEVTWDLTYEER